MALILNGTTDYVDVGSSALLQPPAFTMCCWVNANSLANAYSGLITARTGANYIDLYVKSDGRIAFYTSAGPSFDSTVNSPSISIGAWCHVAFVYDVSIPGAFVYVNGTLNTSVMAGLVANTATGADLVFGNDLFTAGRTFAGTISDGCVYNLGLSANDVAMLASGISPLAIRASNLAGYWPLQGSQAALDRGPNGFLATLVGKPSGADDPPFLIPYRKRVFSANSAPRLNPNSIFPFGEWQMPALLAAAGVPTGAWASVEAADVAAFNGTIAVTGTLATTESPDTAAFNGNTVVSGTWASTEAADTAVFAGNTVASGSFAVTEAQDVASFAGSGIVSGTFAATDTPDTAVLSGNAGTSGSLSATTSQDVAVFAGNFGISGTLAVTEGADLAVFVGQFGIPSGTLAANDNADIAAFTGSTAGAPSGALAATEVPDNLVFLIDYKAPPSVTAPSPYPSPFDYGWSYGEPPLRPGMPGSGTGRSS